MEASFHNLRALSSFMEKRGRIVCLTIGVLLSPIAQPYSVGQTQPPGAYSLEAARAWHLL